jgi:hypothetical protein
MTDVLGLERELSPSSSARFCRERAAVDPWVGCLHGVEGDPSRPGRVTFQADNLCFQAPAIGISHFGIRPFWAWQWSLPKGSGPHCQGAKRGVPGRVDVYSARAARASGGEVPRSSSCVPHFQAGKGRSEGRPYVTARSRRQRIPRASGGRRPRADASPRGTAARAQGRRLRDRNLALGRDAHADLAAWTSNDRTRAHPPARMLREPPR